MQCSSSPGQENTLHGSSGKPRLQRCASCFSSENVIYQTTFPCWIVCDSVHDVDDPISQTLQFSPAPLNDYTPPTRGQTGKVKWGNVCPTTWVPVYSRLLFYIQFHQRSCKCISSGHNMCSAASWFNLIDNNMNKMQLFIVDWWVKMTWGLVFLATCESRTGDASVGTLRTWYFY